MTDLDHAAEARAQVLHATYCPCGGYVPDDFKKEPTDDHPCGDWPAPCNCDDPETHGGHR